MTFFILGMCKFKHMLLGEGAGYNLFDFWACADLSTCPRSSAEEEVGGMTFLILRICKFKLMPESI